MPPDFKAKMRKIRFPLEALPLTPVGTERGGGRMLFTKQIYSTSIMKQLHLAGFQKG